MSEALEAVKAAYEIAAKEPNNTATLAHYTLGLILEEMTRLQSLAGAVSPGPSLFDLKEHELRLHVGDKVYSSVADMKKSDNPFVRSIAEAVKLDVSREVKPADGPDSVNAQPQMTESGAAEQTDSRDPNGG